MNTVGNEIWFSAVDNKDKTAYTMSEALMQEAAEKLELSGINYYAFTANAKGKTAARICVNTKDTEKLEAILGEDIMNVLKASELAKPYSPPEKNIIGNAEYRYIPDKKYHTSGADVALRVAQELEREGIQFSGCVYGPKKAVITVSSKDYNRVVEIEKEIIHARKHTFYELTAKRSEKDNEIQHSEDQRELQDSGAEHDNRQAAAISGDRTVRTDASEISGGRTTGSPERNAEQRNTVPSPSGSGRTESGADPESRTGNDDSGHRVQGSRTVRELPESSRTAEQLPSGSGRNDQERDNLQLNIIGNTAYRDIPDKIYYNNVVNEELYNKYIKSTIDNLGIHYSGQVKDGMVTFTVSAKDAANFEKYMNVARNIYLIDSALAERGFSDEQISSLASSTAEAATLDYISIDTHLEPKYSSEQLSELAAKAIELKKITNIFSPEYAAALKEIEDLKTRFDISISLNEKGFSSEQQDKILAAIGAGFDVSSISAIDSTFSADEIDKFTDLIINNNFKEAVAFAQEHDDKRAAINAISDFYISEYGDDTHLPSSENVFGLAYTSDEIYGQEYEIQVNADLDKAALITTINSVVVKEEQYENLAEMTRLALSNLNFDELVSIEDEELQKAGIRIEEDAPTIEQDSSERSDVHSETIESQEKAFFWVDERIVPELQDALWINNEYANKVVSVFASNAIVEDDIIRNEAEVKMLLLKELDEDHIVEKAYSILKSSYPVTIATNEYEDKPIDIWESGLSVYDSDNQLISRNTADSESKYAWFDSNTVYKAAPKDIEVQQMYDDICNIIENLDVDEDYSISKMYMEFDWIDFNTGQNAYINALDDLRSGYTLNLRNYFEACVTDAEREGNENVLSDSKHALELINKLENNFTYKAIEREGLAKRLSGQDTEKYYVNYEDKSVTLTRYSQEKQQLEYYNVYEKQLEQALSSDNFREYILANCFSYSINSKNDSFDYDAREFFKPDEDFNNKDNAADDELREVLDRFQRVDEKAQEEIEPEYTDKEMSFLTGDIVKFMAKADLAWDEIEDMGYVLFEKGYTDKHNPGENIRFGYNLPETVLYDLSRRMNNGEDIRKDLALAMLGNQKTFRNSDWDEFTIEYGEDSFIAKYGKAEREVTYEDMGEGYMSLIQGEYDDIVQGRTVQDLHDELPELSEDTAKELIAVFDGAVMHDWENDQIKTNRIKQALNGILNNEEQTEKAFASIAYMKYDVRIEEEKAAEQPAKTDTEDEEKVNDDAIEEVGKISIYDDIREKLVAKGVPREEIAFIHEAKNETAKAEMFAKVRRGDIRVLIGSTAKMGCGTNVQTKLVALHDLDAPWRPADMEQRRGRMVRQGNENKKVHLFRYVTEKTFDSYLFQTLENKQKFIGQIMTSKSPARNCADVDANALSYSEVKALCAGNPLIKEKMTLENEIAELKMIKSSYDNQHYQLQDNVLKKYPVELDATTKRIECIKSDIQHLETVPDRLNEDGKKILDIKICGVNYNDREKAGEALLSAMREKCGSQFEKMETLAEYKGFKISISFNTWQQQYVAELKRENLPYRINLGTSTTGNITRIENAISGLPKELEIATAREAELKTLIEEGKLEMNKPFPQAAELHDKMERLAQIEIELQPPEKVTGKDAKESDKQTAENTQEKPLFSRSIQRDFAEKAKNESPDNSQEKEAL